MSIYRIIEAIYKMKASIAVITHQMKEPQLILQESKMLYAKQAILLTDEKMEHDLKDSYNSMLKFLNRSEKKNLYESSGSIHDDEYLRRISKRFVSIFTNNSNRGITASNSEKSPINATILKKLSDFLSPSNVRRQQTCQPANVQLKLMVGQNSSLEKSEISSEISKESESVDKIDLVDHIMPEGNQQQEGGQTKDLKHSTEESKDFFTLSTPIEEVKRIKHHIPPASSALA